MLDTVGSDTLVPDVPAPEAQSSAPETPSPDAAGPSDGGNPDSRPDGQPRDAHGRFASGQADPLAAPDDADPGADPAAVDELGNAPATPDAPDAQPGTQPADALPTAPTPEPAAPDAFTFRHRGQDYAVEGLRVAPEQAQRVHQMLALAREAETVLVPSLRQAQREHATLRAQLDAKSAEGDMLAQLMALPDEQMVGALLEFKQQLPVLREQSRVARLEAENAALRGQQQGQPAQAGQPDPAAELAEHISHGTRTAFTEAIRQVPELAGLTEADVAALAPQLERNAWLYVREATDEDERVDGIAAGSPVIDRGAFTRAAVAASAPLLTQRRQSAEQRARTAQQAAAAQNRARTTVPNVPPSPTPGAVNAPERPEITRDDWRRMKGG